MVRAWFVAWFFKKELDALLKKQDELNFEVNRRVAEHIAKLDPLEVMMQEFSGIFSKEFERVEDQLNEVGRTTMAAWGWQQTRDPSFNRMIDWVIDTQANETLKRAPVTTARVEYGRAQISGMILLRKEVGRLGTIYQEMLDRGKDDEFNSEITAE